MPAIPAHMKGKAKSGRAAQVAQEDSGIRFGDAANLGKQTRRIADVMQHRIAQDEVEAGIAKRQCGGVALEEAEVPRRRRPPLAHTRLLSFSGTMNHRWRAVDAKKSPFRQSRGKLHKNLTGPAANIERATRERADQAKRMFHEAIVDFA